MVRKKAAWPRSRIVLTTGEYKRLRAIFEKEKKQKSWRPSERWRFRRVTAKQWWLDDPDGFAHSELASALLEQKKPSVVKRARGLLYKGCRLGNGYACSLLGEYYERHHKPPLRGKALSFYEKGCDKKRGYLGCFRLGSHILHHDYYTVSKRQDQEALKAACRLFQKACTAITSACAMKRRHCRALP
jgi:TPR repeat protein